MTLARAPVAIDLLPRYGYKSVNNPNSIGFAYSNLVSREIAGVSWQVATYIDSGSRGIVCVRQLPFGAWKLYDLGASYLTADDSHNTFVVGIDADGYLHFAYDHHVDPLNYRKSDAPLATWTGGVTAQLNMLNTTPENTVSYPQFIVAPTGEMYFHFRDGGSGDGNNYLYIYDESTTSWSAASGTGTNGVYLDGKSTTPDYNLYPNRPWVFSSDWDGAGTGFMLITGTLRETTAGDTNNNIYLLKYTGTGFTDFAGTAQTIPATADNMTAIQTIAGAEYLVNDCGQCLDSNNVPHLAYYKHDASDYHQMYHLWHNGTSWVESQLTSWTAASAGADRGRPDMACDLDTDVVYMWITAPGSMTENTEGILEFASDPADFTTWTKRTLYAANMLAYEPRHDPAQWDQHKILSFMVMHAKDVSPPDEVPRIVTCSPAAVTNAFASESWTRTQPITISALASGSVSGFSALLQRVHFDDEVCSPTDANRAQPDGGDLRFFSDSGLTTQLPCAIIKFGYDSTDAAGDADVQIRVGGLSLSDAGTTTIYSAHGNATVVQPFITETYGAQAALPTARYHPLQRNASDLMDEGEYTQRPEDGTTLAYDSTGATFDPADSAPLRLMTGSMGVNTSFAVAAMIDVAASPSDDAQIFSADGSSSNRVLHFRIRSASPAGGIGFVRFNSSNGVLSSTSGTSDLRNAGPTRVVVQWDSTAGEKVIVSGTVENSSSNTTAGQDPATADWFIGGRLNLPTTLDDLFDGSIGHVEFHGAARNDAWWATDALMFESPATFASAGVAAAIPTGFTPPTIGTPTGVSLTPTTARLTIPVTFS